MLYDSTSSEETSSEIEDDLELLLLDTMFTRKRLLGPRINLQDIDEFQCEQWFRYARYVLTVANRKKEQNKCLTIFISADFKREICSDYVWRLIFQKYTLVAKEQLRLV